MSKVIMTLLMLLYHVVSTLILPVYLVILCFRVWKKKDTLASSLKRFVINLAPRLQGRLIWIHAASIGESVIAITLISALNSLHSQLKFLVTSGTIASANMLKKQLPQNAIHQMIPFDNIFIVRRFLNHWQPDLGIFIESEIWPALITQAATMCKLLLINARLSDKSFARWSCISFVFQHIVSNFTLVMTQSERDLMKFQKLGVNKVVNYGNIKFANEKLSFNQEHQTQLLQALKGKKIIVAASTHLEDEQVLLPVICHFKTNYINYPVSYYFIIILRHPERCNAVAKHCLDHNLTYTLRSESLLASYNDDLYIVDTFGEVGLFYSIADIAFVGGSFSKGGHNPLEPAHFGKVIMFGPDMSNCRMIAEEMVNSRVALQIDGSKTLIQAIERFTNPDNHQEIAEYANNSLQFIQKYNQVLRNYLQVILQYTNSDNT